MSAHPSGRPASPARHGGRGMHGCQLHRPNPFGRSRLPYATAKLMHFLRISKYMSLTLHISSDVGMHPGAPHPRRATVPCRCASASPPPLADLNVCGGCTGVHPYILSLLCVCRLYIISFHIFICNLRGGFDVGMHPGASAFKPGAFIQLSEMSGRVKRTRRMR